MGSWLFSEGAVALARVALKNDRGNSTNVVVAPEEKRTALALSLRSFGLGVSSTEGTRHLTVLTSAAAVR